MPSTNEKIVIITGALLKFEVTGAVFELNVQSTTEGGPPVSVVTVKDKDLDVVAAFTDVHAIFYKKSGEMIAPEDD